MNKPLSELGSNISEKLMKQYYALSVVGSPEVVEVFSGCAQSIAEIYSSVVPKKLQIDIFQDTIKNNNLIGDNERRELLNLQMNLLKELVDLLSSLSPRLSDLVLLMREDLETKLDGNGSCKIKKSLDDVMKSTEQTVGSMISYMESLVSDEMD